MNMAERIYIFKGFERFWHWAQAALIITLLITGFEIHGTYKLGSTRPWIPTRLRPGR